MASGENEQLRPFVPYIGKRGRSPRDGIALRALHRRRRDHHKHACTLGCEGIVSKRLGSPYRGGRADCWVKVKNPAAPAVTREAEEEWN